MSKPITAAMNGVKYCMVRIPFMAVSYLRYKVDNKLSILFGSRSRTGDFSSIETLPKGNWSIVGIAKNLMEDQCAVIVEKVTMKCFVTDTALYKDYSGRPGIDYYSQAMYSLKSWLVSIGADENYMILKQIK